MALHSYAEEKLGLAFDELEGEGSEKQKLLRVATRTLSAVFADDFPPEFRTQFEEIHAALTSKGTKDQTIEQMTEEEAAAVNRKIGDLYEATRRASP